jgi:2,4-dienoyl-CoA reductase-like NADH-dependent reductase (Old Yellow Enzyme family)
VTHDVGKLEPLFKEGRVGTMRLRNRFVRSLLFTQYATTWGEASDRLIEYHRARALGVTRGRRARDDRGDYRRGAARPARENTRGKEGGGRMRSFIHDALPGRLLFVRGLLEENYAGRRPGLAAERRI